MIPLTGRNFRRISSPQRLVNLITNRDLFVSYNQHQLYGIRCYDDRVLIVNRDLIIFTVDFNTDVEPEELGNGWFLEELV